MDSRALTESEAFSILNKENFFESDFDLLKQSNSNQPVIIASLQDLQQKLADLVKKQEESAKIKNTPFQVDSMYQSPLNYLTQKFRKIAKSLNAQQINASQEAVGKFQKLKNAVTFLENEINKIPYALKTLKYSELNTIEELIAFTENQNIILSLPEIGRMVYKQYTSLYRSIENDTKNTRDLSALNQAYLVISNELKNFFDKNQSLHTGSQSTTKTQPPAAETDQTSQLEKILKKFGTTISKLKQEVSRNDVDVKLFVLQKYMTAYKKVHSHNIYSSEMEKVHAEQFQLNADFKTLLLDTLFDNPPTTYRAPSAKKATEALEILGFKSLGIRSLEELKSYAKTQNLDARKLIRKHYENIYEQFHNPDSPRYSISDNFFLNQHFVTLLTGIEALDEPAPKPYPPLPKMTPPSPVNTPNTMAHQAASVVQTLQNNYLLQRQYFMNQQQNYVRQKTQYENLVNQLSPEEKKQEELFQQQQQPIQAAVLYQQTVYASQQAMILGTFQTSLQNPLSFKQAQVKVIDSSQALSNNYVMAVHYYSQLDQFYQNKILEYQRKEQERQQQKNACSNNSVFNTDNRKRSPSPNPDDRPQKKLKSENPNQNNKDASGPKI